MKSQTAIKKKLRELREKKVLMFSNSLQRSRTIFGIKLLEWVLEESDCI